MSVLAPLLASASTSQMVAVSPAYLVSAYLETCDHVGVRSSFEFEENAVDSSLPCVRVHNIDLYRDTRSLDRPCGLFCPLLWRRSFNFDGMLEFSHGGWDVGSTQHIVSLPNNMRSERLRWRLGHTCDNPRCPNYMAAVR
jgi:hypothetical protein